MMNAVKLLVDPVYKDHIHAIRCALGVSASALGPIAGRWQQEYQSGWRISSVDSNMSRNERFTQDCMTRHLLRQKLTKEQWALLVIRFAPPVQFQGRVIADQSEVEEMQRALETLLASMKHPVSKEFSVWCLQRWACRMPAGRGKWVEWEGRTNVSMPTLHRRCASSVYKPMVALEHETLERAKSELMQSGLIA